MGRTYGATGRFPRMPNADDYRALAFALARYIADAKALLTAGDSCNAAAVLHEAQHSHRKWTTTARWRSRALSLLEHHGAKSVESAGKRYRHGMEVEVTTPAALARATGLTTGSA